MVISMGALLGRGGRLWGARCTTPLLTARRHKAQNQVTAWCDAHMNELPVPCGPWEPYYRAQQAYYTKTLLAGVLVFVVSLSTLVLSGSMPGPWTAPDEPAPETPLEYDECED